ncbi:MAG: Hsp70 family protein [Lachnospiraceae bacterium]|nr:Hsp70 family protein [Lachnospiraceae bacterium]
MGKPISKALMDAKVSAHDITQVVLVGGSCKMPVVQQYLQHLLGREDIVALEPDYMIALGCGISAGIKERNEEIKDMLLTDICPFSLGTGIVNHNNKDKDLMSFIIERNSPLPITRERSYQTVYDNQKQICFKIYQGEGMYAEENILLGETELEVPPKPAGEVKFLVRFTYDINGILEVEVKVSATGETKRLVIVNKELGMTQSQVEEKLREFERLKVNPSENEENRYVLEWGQRLFMQSSNEQVRYDILKKLQYFEYVMAKDVYQVPKVRKYTTVFFAYIEKMLNRYVSFSDDVLADGSWYQEDDEDEKEIDNLFHEWDEKDK